jgi:hypothetical protein
MIEFEGRLPGDRLIAEANRQSLNSFSDAASNYFTEERVKAIAFDAAVCYSAIQPILEFAAATAIEPPVGALAGVTWAMGLASCIALSGVSLFGADSDIRGAQGISGLFTPEGLFLGTVGALNGEHRCAKAQTSGRLQPTCVIYHRI